MKKHLILICLLLVSLLLVGCKDNNTAAKLTTAKKTTITTQCVHDITTIPGYAETCTEDGLTDGLYCSKCNVVFKEQVPIEAHHNYKLSKVSLKKNVDYDKYATYKCDDCNSTYIKELTYEDIGIPIITIIGSLDGISKDDKVKVKIDYQSEELSFQSDATLKIQGGSSAYYPKNNFTVQFLKEDGSKNKIKIVEDWGKESKYCMKANYIDYSQARNVVSAKLYGDIAHSRNLEDEFANLVNGGAIDGFPILVYYNDDFYGLYTFNIPKDNWLFDMKDDDKNQAILMGDDWQPSVALREHVALDFSNGWDLEYCSTDDEEWVSESFNEMMDFVNNSTMVEFINNSKNYINVDRAIDSMLYTMMICAVDNGSKNILWVTYDGTIWTPCVYDMDGVYGLYWNGDVGVVQPDTNMPQVWCGANALWEKLFKTMQTRIKNRYFEIRENAMSIENIENRYQSFFDEIPELLYIYDAIRWPEVPSHETNNYDQIIDYISARLEILDKYFNTL